MKNKEYKVFAGRESDINEGFIWISKDNDEFSPRAIIKIEDIKNKKIVYCEYLAIDNNFKVKYNENSFRVKIKEDENTIIINSWYRKELGGIETKQIREFSISEVKGLLGLWGKFQAIKRHPQMAIRQAMWLGIISVSLGILGVILGIIGFIR